MADNNVQGLVNDPQFQALSPAEQRRALAGVTRDNAFTSLDDAGTQRFIQGMTRPPTPRAVVRLGENALSGLGITSNEQAKQFFAHPLSTAMGMFRGQGQLAMDARDAYRRGDYKGAVIHGLNYLVPFIGQQTDLAGRQLSQGDIAGGIGRTLGLAVGLKAFTPEGMTAIARAPVKAAQAGAKAAPVTGTVLGGLAGGKLGSMVGERGIGAGVGALYGHGIGEAFARRMGVEPWQIEPEFMRYLPGIRRLSGARAPTTQLPPRPVPPVEPSSSIPPEAISPVRSVPGEVVSRETVWQRPMSGLPQIGQRATMQLPGQVTRPPLGTTRQLPIPITEGEYLPPEVRGALPPGQYAQPPVAQQVLPRGQYATPVPATRLALPQRATAIRLPEAFLRRAEPVIRTTPSEPLRPLTTRPTALTQAGRARAALDQLAQQAEGRQAQPPPAPKVTMTHPPTIEPPPRLTPEAQERVAMAERARAVGAPRRNIKGSVQTRIGESWIDERTGAVSSEKATAEVKARPSRQGKSSGKSSKPKGTEFMGNYQQGGIIPGQPSRYQMNLPQGMLVPGNINLHGRPIIRNADGSFSTEFSTSFGDRQGREVLVPTIANGRFLTPTGTRPPAGYRDNTGRYHPTREEKAMWARARQRYAQTGEHMGIFDTPANADAYAWQVHNRPMIGNLPLHVYTPSTQQLMGGIR